MAATTKEGGVYLPALYKRFVAKIAQATTAAPTIGTAIADTYDGSSTALTLARTSAGIYTFTRNPGSAEFTTKTICFFTSTGAAPRAFNYAITSTDVITVTVLDVATPSAADSGNFDMEIRTYA